MKTIIKNKDVILTIVIYALLLLIVIGIFVYDIVVRVTRGWENNDTIHCVFFVFIAISGTSMIVSLQKYLVSKNKEVVYCKNDFYRLFISSELNGSIGKYEDYLIRKQKNHCLKQMSSLLSKKKYATTISNNNIGDFFNIKNGIYNGDVKISFFKELKLNKLFEKYESEKSYNYEVFYAEVHNGELITKKKFPIYDVLLPVLFGFVGLFATIYQALSASSNLNESLFEYLKLFGSVMMFALVYSLLTLKSAVESEMSKRKKELNELKNAVDIDIK